MNVKCTECVVKIVKTPREATSVYVKQVINWSLIRKRVKRKVIFLLVIFLCVLMNSNCLWDYGVFMGLKNVVLSFLVVIFLVVVGWALQPTHKCVCFEY